MTPHDSAHFNYVRSEPEENRENSAVALRWPARGLWSPRSTLAVNVDEVRYGPISNELSGISINSYQRELVENIIG